MSTYSSEQGLVFMRPAQGLPVELIHYCDDLRDTSPSPLQITLPQSPGCDAIKDLTCKLEFSPVAPIPSLISHFVADLEAARQFWEGGLGFKPCSVQNCPPGTLKLGFRGVMPSWNADILLVPRPKYRVRGLLDGPGFRCLSIICRDIGKLVNRLAERGYTQTSGRMRLKVDSKRLELEMIHATDGLMIELMQIDVSSYKL